MKKIAIACDHAGFIAKPVVLAFLEERGFEVLDFGTMSEDTAKSELPFAGRPSWPLWPANTTTPMCSPFPPVL